MKVGARVPDLRRRVSSGSGEQIHSAQPRCPGARAGTFVLGAEELSPPRGDRRRPCAALTSPGFGAEAAEVGRQGHK